MICKVEVEVEVEGNFNVLPFIIHAPEVLIIQFISKFIHHAKNTITHLVLETLYRTSQNHLPNTEGIIQLLGQAFKELLIIYAISLPNIRQRYCIPVHL